MRESDPIILIHETGQLVPLSELARRLPGQLAAVGCVGGLQDEALSELLIQAWRTGHHRPESLRQAFWRVRDRQSRALTRERPVGEIHPTAPGRVYVDPGPAEVDLRDSIEVATRGEKPATRRLLRQWLLDPAGEILHKSVGFRTRWFRRRRLAPFAEKIRLDE